MAISLTQILHGNSGRMMRGGVRRHEPGVCRHYLEAERYLNPLETYINIAGTELRGQRIKSQVPQLHMRPHTGPYEGERPVNRRLYGAPRSYAGDPD